MDDQAESPEALLKAADGDYDVVTQIEDMLVLGHSRGQIYLWALDQGMSTDQVEVVIRMIKKLRVLDQDPEVSIERRFEQRERYLRVFRRAMATEKLDTALKTLDSLSKFDGMILPDVNVTLNQNATITSRTRERVQELMDRMTSMSERKAGTQVVIDTTSTDKLLATGAGTAPATRASDHEHARADQSVIKERVREINNGRNGHARVKEDPRNPKDEDDHGD